MNSVLDSILVGVALLVSAGYALASLGPRSLRRRVLAAFSRFTGRAPVFLHLRRTAQWFAFASGSTAKGSCGGCDGCSTEQATAPTPGTPTPVMPAAEVSVPVGQIGRRA